MKNILLLAHDDIGQEARLQAALDIVRRFEGHLSCLDVPIVPEVVGNYCSEPRKGLIAGELCEPEATNRHTLEARLAVEQVPWSWEDSSDDLTQGLLSAASLADLVILNRDLGLPPLPDTNAAIGDTLAQARVPILAVTGKAGFDMDGRALIAWNGSPAASAALRAAVPLLRLASEVVIYVADDGTIKLPAENAAIYLSRHGVHATISRDFAAGRSPADMILAEVERGRPSYLVMGGFGHSRYLESWLANVTGKMLHQCPVPIFLVHLGRCW
jgi:nucleotide-binding universal stress UspA family protein